LPEREDEVQFLTSLERLRDLSVPVQVETVEFVLAWKTTKKMSGT
jgi:hypothetical protein